MRFTLFVATLALAIAEAPVSGQSREGGAPNPGGRPQTTERKDQNRAESKKGQGDQLFVMTVAKDSMAEVELGRLASEKATSADVKRFAQRMVDDHSKANEELKTLAQTKNITLPNQVEPKHKAEHERLAKLTGSAFDRAYMQAMVRDHRKAV